MCLGHRQNSMGPFVAFFGLAATILIFWYVRERVRHAERNKLLDKFNNKFPVRAFPLVGHLWYFLGALKNLMGAVNETFAKSESPFVLWLGIVPTVHLARLEDIEDVSRICVNRNTYKITEGTIEDGIFTQTGEKWKKTRRLMTPAFGQIMLTQYLQVFNEQTQVLVNLLHQKAVEGEYFDLWPFLINANIDIITENMTGIQSDCQRSQGNEYSEAFLKIIFMTLNRVLNPFLLPNFVYKFYLYLTGLSRHVEKLHEYPRKKINEVLKNKDNTIQYRERTSLSSVLNIPKHMIDILLVDHIKDPTNMTEKQISSEMIHLIAAGSETTAINNCLTLLMYGIHQAEQEAVYQEIKRIIPEDRPITMEDLDQLDYTEKTIKETLRFFSVAPLTYRTTLHALTLSSGNTIPDDTEVFLHLRQLHENPLYYPNPSKWNPENFNEEAIEARPKNSFAPFGIGSRSCIGSKYAMLSMKVQISHLLRKYQIFTDTKLDEIVLDQDVLRRSQDGYRVKLRIRDS